MINELCLSITSCVDFSKGGLEAAGGTDWSQNLLESEAIKHVRVHGRPLCRPSSVQTMAWWKERSAEHAIGWWTTTLPRRCEVVINGRTGPFRAMHRVASERRWDGGLGGATSFLENSTRKQRQERGSGGRKLHPLSKRNTVAMVTPRGTESTEGAEVCDHAPSGENGNRGVLSFTQGVHLFRDDTRRWMDGSSSVFKRGLS